MTKQELKELIAEVKYSDMPKPSKKKLMNILYEKMHKEEGDSLYQGRCRAEIERNGEKR